MRLHNIILLGISSLGLLLGGSFAAMAQYQGLTTDSPVFGEQTIGNTSVVVKTVTGTVESDTRYLRYEDDVYHNEVIETLEDSATEITFLDETTISLGPNTNVTLDRFVYDPDPDNAAFVLTIGEGALRFVSGVLPSDAYQINTPVATIGIRGTVVDIVVDDEIGGDGLRVKTVKLAVVEGEADFINCRGEVVSIPAGWSSHVVGSAKACSAASALSPLPEAGN